MLQRKKVDNTNILLHSLFTFMLIRIIWDRYLAGRHKTFWLHSLGQVSTALSPRQILTLGGVRIILSSPSRAMSPPKDVANTVSCSTASFNSSTFFLARGVIFKITIVLFFTSSFTLSISLLSLSGNALRKTSAVGASCSCFDRSGTADESTKAKEGLCFHQVRIIYRGLAP